MFDVTLPGDRVIKIYQEKNVILSSNKHKVISIFADPSRKDILEFIRKEEARG